MTKDAKNYISDILNHLESSKEILTQSLEKIDFLITTARSHNFSQNPTNSPEILKSLTYFNQCASFSINCFNNEISMAISNFTEEISNIFRNIDSIVHSKNPNKSKCNCPYTNVEIEKIAMKEKLIISQGKIYENCTKCNKLIPNRYFHKKVSLQVSNSLIKKGFIIKIKSKENCEICKNKGGYYFPCKHTFCAQCIYQNFAETINSIVTSDKIPGKIYFQCPIIECPSKIFLTDSYKILQYNLYDFQRLMRPISILSMKNKEKNYEFCCMNCLTNFPVLSKNCVCEHLIFCNQCELYFLYIKK